MNILWCQFNRNSPLHVRLFRRSRTWRSNRGTDDVSRMVDVPAYTTVLPAPVD